MNKPLSGAAGPTGEGVTLRILAKTIDHSLLHPTMTDEEILKGCALARTYDVATVCVKPYAVSVCREALAGSAVEVCSVIGFPHGNSRTDIKVAETTKALTDGATEIDMVINIGKALAGQWDYVSDEIKAVNDMCVDRHAILKVIFETDYLQDEHIIRLCEICSQHKVAFVKTSSGYGFVRQANGLYSYVGAMDHNLSLMRAHCAPEVQIKAAGGVRTLDDLLRVRALGVTRIGTSGTETILEDAKTRGYR
ncbi:MAG TPA: deoxyribose-phosphate aldolase [Anaerolineae bacterium]|nr:deoxyribose-phosphate aldolase [Anaerolineae bacterium]